MEKIKSLLSPGKPKDDETLYGQGNNGAVSGEGSHFTGNTTTGTGAGNTSGVGSSTSTGLGHNSGTGQLGNTASTTTGQTSHNPLSSNEYSSTNPTSTTTGTTGQSAHNPLSSSTHPTSSAAGGYGSTGASGMPGTFSDENTSTTTGNRGLTAGELVGAESQTGYTHQTTGTSGLTGNNHQTGTSGLTGNNYQTGTSGLTGNNYQTGTSGLSGNNYQTTGSSGLTGNTQQTTGSSGLTGNATQHHTGRDVALGAGAAGLAGEGIHHHRENERAQDVGTSGLGGSSVPVSGSGYGTAPTGTSAGTSSAGYPGTTASGATTGAFHGGPQGTAVKGPHTTSTANALDPGLHNARSSELESAHIHETDNAGRRVGGGAEEADQGHRHTGRDAALGAGAVGAGAAGYEHHKHDKDLTTAEREAKREHKHELKEEKKHAHDQKHAHDTTTGHSTTGHHTGRDTVVGAGAGAGALGVAEHERTQHSNIATSGPGSDVAAQKSAQMSDLSGPAPGTSGPHSKDWMNKLDPRVDSAGPATGSTGSLATTDTTGTDHAMKNRSAYIDPEARNNPGFVDTPQHPVGRSGLIGASGAGAAGVGAYELGKHHEGGRPATNQAGTAGSTTGILDGTSGNNHSNLGSGGVPTSTATQQHHKDHHLGRDAVGAGAVGGTAYEAEKHHHNKGVNDPNYSSSTGTSSYPTTGSSTGTSAYPVTGTSTGTHDPTHKDHHYGRDAAGTGAVGGAAYEAEKHHKHDKDLTAAEKEAKKEHKHELKEEKKHEQEEKKSGGFLSFLHRDKNKKYTKEEEDDFDRQEKEHNSHGGRDAAAVGAVGTGAYEAEKHHGHHSGNTNKPLPNEPGSTYGTSSTLADRSVHDSSTGHHAGSHAQKWEGGDGPTTEYAPPGSTLGDKLHGVDRNRGVSNTEFGTGDRHRLHKDPPASHPASHGGVTSDGRQIEQGTGLVSSTPIYDSNATTGTSGIGHSGIGQSLGTSGQGYSSGTSGIGHSGLGQSTGTSGQGYSTGNSGLEHSSGTTNTTGTHVPASSEARKDLVREGERGLDTNTGVHHAGNQPGSTNY